jgi:peptide/nickel transport system ATP-binding protein
LAESVAPIVAVSGLSKTFAGRRGAIRGTRSSVEAVRDVSFELHPGTTLGIVGESGSGKTTIARILVGLERRTSGAVEIGGVDFGDRTTTDARLARSRLIQMVFQDPFTSLDPHMRIGAGTDEIQRVHFERSRDEREARTIELLEAVGLSERHAARTPARLSGGQRQRAAIARVLAAEPQVIVLDEAVSALDVSIQAQILNLLHDLRERLGLTYILISHDLAVVRQLADDVIVLYRGTVVERGGIDAVLTDPEHPYTRRLIASVPRAGLPLELRRHAGAAAVGGRGCTFAPRCELRHDACEEEPPLDEVAAGHAVRCWLTSGRAQM